MTLDEALLYDAEWWINTDTEQICIWDTLEILEEYGYSSVDGSPLDCSWFCLLVREAIRND